MEQYSLPYSNELSSNESIDQSMDQLIDQANDPPLDADIVLPEATFLKTDHLQLYTEDWADVTNLKQSTKKSTS